MTTMQFIWLFLSSVGIISVLFLLLTFSGFWEERPIDVSNNNYLIETTNPNSTSSGTTGASMKAQLPVTSESPAAQ